MIERDEETKTYCIVRFYAPPRNEREVVKTGLTLGEAQAHCHSPYTRGEDWFDGYTEE